jgi:integrase
LRDWRTHRLIRFDSVSRWMHDLKCKDSSKAKYLEAFEVFLHAIGAKSPDQLIDGYIQDMRSDDPRVRLRTQDRMNRFLDDYGKRANYQAWLSFVAARSFYNGNGCPVAVRAPFPKQPKREQSEDIIGRVNKLTPTMAKLASPVLRSLILTLAESGMRVGSAVQVRYADIKADYETNALPMAIRLRGRITKTGLPYWAFVLDDARDAIRDQLEMRKGRGDIIGDDTLLFPMCAPHAMQQIRDLGDLVGLNVKKSGLREFSTKMWRKRLQSILERDEYHINPNHVSLLLQAKPKGRDAHYSMPPREELAREYMKAANELRVSGPLFVKPTMDELLQRIQALAPDERLRLISELEKHKAELGHAARPDLLAGMLSELGLVETKIKPVVMRWKRRSI